VRGEKQLKRGDAPPAEGTVDEEAGAKAPAILPESEWVWRLFSMLSAHRLFTDRGPQPLSITDMWSLAQIEELSTAETRFFREVCTELDNVFIREMSEKLAKDRDKENKKRNKRGPRPVRGRLP